MVLTGTGKAKEFGQGKSENLIMLKKLENFTQNIGKIRNFIN